MLATRIERASAEESPMVTQHGTLTRLMAARCDHCPLCQYARKNPDKPISKVVALHGTLCPFWRSWQKVYGQ